MHKGYRVTLSVYVCVCYRASCYMPRLYDVSDVSFGFPCRFQYVYLYCVDFVENTLDKRDSNGFFSRRLACRTGNSSSKLTDSSLHGYSNNSSMLVQYICSARMPNLCLDT